MLTWFCYTKMPKSAKGIIKGDIKPAPSTDTTGIVSTGNLGDYNVPVPLLVSTAALRGHNQKFSMPFFPDSGNRHIDFRALLIR